MALTDPWSGEDDDTDCDYYDTPSGNILAPRRRAPGSPPATNPGPPARSPAAKRRPGSDRPGRGASLSFPDRPHVASPPRAWTRMS
jgi:hypothetical protein